MNVTGKNLHLSGAIDANLLGGFMHKGMVKWFNDLKGYGFIICKDMPHELYVRFTEIRTTGYRTLKEGDEVLFEVDEASNGRQAVNVVKL
jgi:cold shock protein